MTLAVSSPKSALRTRRQGRGDSTGSAANRALRDKIEALPRHSQPTARRLEKRLLRDRDRAINLVAKLEFSIQTFPSGQNKEEVCANLRELQKRAIDAAVELTCAIECRDRKTGSCDDIRQDITAGGRDELNGVYRAQAGIEAVLCDQEETGQAKAK